MQTNKRFPCISGKRNLLLGLRCNGDHVWTEKEGEEHIGYQEGYEYLLELSRCVLCKVQRKSGLVRKIE